MKLRDNTPLNYGAKFDTKVFNLTKRFPFKDKSFEGVFCASTLHYFPKDILSKIISEVDRILKPNGKIFLEFATDIKRVLSDGKLFIRKSEPQYTFNEGKKYLEEILKNYKVKILKSAVTPEEIKTERYEYKLSCKLIILIAEKNLSNTIRT